jgi:hypothetical protein
MAKLNLTENDIHVMKISLGMSINTLEQIPPQFKIMILNNQMKELLDKVSQTTVDKPITLRSLIGELDNSLNTFKESISDISPQMNTDEDFIIEPIIDTVDELQNSISEIQENMGWI